MNKNVLIIGGAGFIGRHIVSQLDVLGADICVLDITSRPKDISAAVKWRQGSILDQAVLQQTMQGRSIVFHLAALAHLGVPQKHRYHQINAIGTKNVLAAARATGTEHLLITSTEVILRDWRRPLTQPLTVPETLPDKSAMAGPYCRSKLDAEIAARRAISAGQAVSILYPTVPVGPGDYNLTAPSAMLKQFITAPPPAYLDCRLNLIAVEDIARAHILAAQKKPGGKYLLGGDDVDMSELLNWLTPLTDKKLPQKTVPYRLAAMTAHIAKLGALLSGIAPLASLEGVKLAKQKIYVDSSASHKALGWSPMPVKPAILRAATWLKTTSL